MLLRELFSLENIDVSVVESVVVASVVPPLDPILEEVARRSFGLGATFVTAENAGIPILYNDPAEVGADRIVDAVAVLDRYSVPAIVVDLEGNPGYRSHLCPRICPNRSSPMWETAETVRIADIAGVAKW